MQSQLFICYTCNVPFNNLFDLEHHTRGQAHAYRMMSLAAAARSSKAAYVCNVCNKTIDNWHNLQSHNSGSSHLKRLRLSMTATRATASSHSNGINQSTSRTIFQSTVASSNPSTARTIFQSTASSNPSAARTIFQSTVASSNPSAARTIFQPTVAPSITVTAQTNFQPPVAPSNINTVTARASLHPNIESSSQDTSFSNITFRSIKKIKPTTTNSNITATISNVNTTDNSKATTATTSTRNLDTNNIKATTTGVSTPSATDSTPMVNQDVSSTNNNNNNNDFYSEQRDIGKCQFFQSALKGHHVDIMFTPKSPWASVEDMFQQFSQFFKDVISHLLTEHSPGRDLKIQFEIHCVFKKLVFSPDGTTKIGEEKKDQWLSTASRAVKEASDLINDDMEKDFLLMIENYEKLGSNWLLESITSAAWTVVKYNPLTYYHGRGARGTDETDVSTALKQLKRCRGVICVDNKGGDDCFRWAMLSVIHHEDVARDYNRNHGRMSSYKKWKDELCFDGMTFPFTIQQIKQFEAKNPQYAVNIYEWIGRSASESDTEIKGPVIIRKQCSSNKGSNRRIISIVMYNNHYYGVVNFNALMNSGLSDYNRKWCERCTRFYYNAADLKAHREWCYTAMRQQEIMPEEDKRFFKFTNWQKIMSPLFVAYADTECLLVKGDAEDRLQKHTPCAIGYIILPCKDLQIRSQKDLRLVFPACVNDYRVFEGRDCVVQFLTSLELAGRELYQWSCDSYNINQRIILPPHYDVIKQYSKFCSLCREPFKADKDKFADHNHLTGKFRYIVCSTCNNKLIIERCQLHVVMHNYKNYDSHALCVEGFGHMKEWKYKVIAQTSERYIMTTASFELLKYNCKTTGADRTLCFRLLFLDSCQFLQTSLQSLVEKMQHDKCYQLHACFGDHEWLYRKGVFPYSWFDSWEKLQCNSFPAKSAFHDTLTDSLNITDEDYNHGLSVWNDQRCSDFGEYMNIYLKCDVLQLADVFEHYRETVMVDDGLEVLNYCTIPGLTWDSAFKFTRCEVELLTDPEMYSFFERGIRGGITFVNKHHIAANHPSVPNTYDVQVPLEQLLYVDANNLYGQCLSMPLPERGFKWMSLEELESVDWLNVDLDGFTGYTLEVDLEYPEAIHDATADLPLACQKMTVKEQWLTPHMKELHSLLYPRKKKFRGTNKLMLTQFRKEKYVVHARVLQLYLALGMKIIGFHRGLSYRQSAYFEPYITRNSLKRQQTSDKFLQDYYKLKNNSLYGKTMEDVRGRKAFKLVNSETEHERHCSKPEFINSIYFTPDLVGVNCSKHKVKLNKPIYVGQCVLDNSKWVMYNLKYRHMARYERMFGGEITIEGGDTDSFFLSLKGIDLGALLQQMINDELLDTSNYSKSHPLFTDDRKAVLGCVKDEAAGQQITEMILLRPKCYSMQLAGEEKKRAKGIQQYVVKNRITHADYKTAYTNSKTIFANTRRIGSSLHQLFTFETSKLALSSFDDKRAWTSLNTSLPYGHYSLPSVEPYDPLPIPGNPNFIDDDDDVDSTNTDNSGYAIDDSDTYIAPATKRARMSCDAEEEEDPIDTLLHYLN